MGIERIRAAKAVTTEAVIEKSVEEVAVEEEAVEEAAGEETAVEEEAGEEAAVEDTTVEAAADEKEADVMDVEEDSPLENWTVKELKEECKTLGLTDKGKKADLIERIREAQGKKSEATPVKEEIALESAADDVPVNEPATEEAAVDESPIEEAAVEKATEKEAAVEEIADERASAEEMAIEAEEVIEKVEEEADGPLEDWTVKELKEECKRLGLTDKGKKAELIARITESRSSSQEAAVETVEEIAEKEVDEEVAAIEEAPVDEASVEDAPVEEAPVEEAPVEEAPVEESPVEDSPVEESTIEETQAPAGEAAADETESQSAGLDPSSISELLAKNEQGQLSQQEFFRIFLVSVQNSLTTNQRLADVEKKLEETAERLEKVEVAADSVSNATTEPEADAPAVQPVSTEEPAVEESTEDPMEEADITSLVENAEKLQPRISRKRAQASGHQKKSARAKRARV